MVLTYSLDSFETEDVLSLVLVYSESRVIKEKREGIIYFTLTLKYVNDNITFAVLHLAVLHLVVLYL